MLPDNLANINKQMYMWTFKFRKVVRQQILGEVADFTPASSAFRLRMQKWKISKVGARLPKFVQTICVDVFNSCHVTHMSWLYTKV